jgi:hypothetical protein
VPLTERDPAIAGYRPSIEGDGLGVYELPTPPRQLGLATASSSQRLKPAKLSNQTTQIYHWKRLAFVFVDSDVDVFAPVVEPTFLGDQQCGARAGGTTHGVTATSGFLPKQAHPRTFGACQRD